MEDYHSGRCELLDLCGRRLWVRDLNRSPQRFDLQGVAPGLYGLHIWRSDGIMVFRIIRE